VKPELFSLCALTYSWRSLRHYRARHGVFAGTVALTSAILCAALLTGESLQAGLRRGLRERLGPVRSAVLLTEGVFPASLAQRLPDTRAALLLSGELLTSEGAVCASGAQIIGSPEIRESGHGEAELNGRAREALPDAAGAVRFAKPSLYAAELPLGALKTSRLVRRSVSCRPAADVRPPPASDLLPDDFALRPASVPPVNVRLPLDALARDAGVPGMANLLVSSLPPQALERALAEALTPDDCGVEISGGDPAAGRRQPVSVVTSRRVFLPAAVGQAVAAAGLAAEAATFHLADAFEAGTHTTPYGFVAAVRCGGAAAGSAEPGGAWMSDLKDDEAVIHAWLAETLGIGAGATLTLRWRRFEAGGRLVPESREFRVRAVIPMAEAAALKRRMPRFPGLEGVDSCAAWDVGLPMDEEKLKDAANEAYWQTWRETPKVILTHAAGTACFGTVFGDAMSLSVAADGAAVRAALKGLAPERLGFRVRPVWEEGAAAARGATDFRLLFSGMAFVLVAAALLLSALSLALALETRRSEIALFRALGWSRRRVTGVLSAEWGAPLAAGALAGGIGGAWLARMLVWGLGRFWRDAFAGAVPGFSFSWPMAALAAGVSAGLAGLVLVRATWKIASGDWQTAKDIRGAARQPARSVLRGSSVGIPLALAALGVMVWSPDGAAANGVFFGAGFLLMLSLFLFFAGVLSAVGRRRALVGGAFAAGLAHVAASPRRSAPVVVLLAVGVFLTVGILSMKHDPAAGSERPWSGSGGFASLVTSAAPLDRERGLALAREASGARGVVPVRVREGDEAGCLNMNAPQSPRLLGLDARAMARARAFEPEDAGGVWTPLERMLPDGAVPALAADQAMLQYSLKAKAGMADGAVLTYRGADGTPWRVRIVGALPVRSGILQGALLVDERFFARMFPEEGYRLWLCDYAPYVLREAADSGGRGRGGRRPPAVVRARHPAPGVTVETAGERLRLLGAVEGTYLDLFLVLGGLGMVLGVAGVALVMLRGVEERRGELALLNAVGLRRRAAVGLLAVEYGVLVAAGLAAGILPALAAIQPAARALGGQLPWGAMAGVVAGLFVCAAVCVSAAACAAANRIRPDALREL
jgi:hypothetical protein